MKRNGFTLTEMLVVLAIIGVLAGIAYPVSRSMLGKARETACLANLRSVGAALQSYQQEHNNIMPDLAQGRATKNDEQPVLETVLLPYLESAEAFHCPADTGEFQKTGSSYFWNSTQSGLHVSKLAIFGIKDRPDKVPLIYDKEAWHPNKVNFLYADMSSSNKFRTVVGN